MVQIRYTNWLEHVRSMTLPDHADTARLNAPPKPDLAACNAEPNGVAYNRRTVIYSRRVYVKTGAP
jgi:hypothetical protein